MNTSLQESVAYFLNLSLYLIPLFIISTFFVGLIREYLNEETIKKKLENKNPFFSYVIAGIMGAVTPFCSCSTIPLLTGMLKSGVPFGLSMTFLLASPLANYIAIFMIGGLLGWSVAFLYVIFIIGAAIIGGLILNSLGLETELKSLAVGDSCDSSCSTSTSACSDTETSRIIEFKDNVKAGFTYSLLFFKDIAPYLFIGMVIGSAIQGFVPEELILEIVGPDRWFAIPAAAIIGAPIYLSMEAMIPIAFSLYGLGMALGAVIALLIGGSGISVPNMIIISRLFKKKLLIAYGLSIIAFATIIGVAFNIIF